VANQLGCVGMDMAHRKVKIRGFRNHFSSYVLRAERGETIAICRRNREVALHQPPKQSGHESGRLLGSLEGTARIVGQIDRVVLREQGWFSDEDS
jgi:antitoxin (DNA-binding transcriptional repressor) of toxin-antitoxin stability system